MTIRFLDKTFRSYRKTSEVANAILQLDTLADVTPITVAVERPDGDCYAQAHTCANHLRGFWLLEYADGTWALAYPTEGKARP
jgi:hypothetical protein